MEGESQDQIACAARLLIRDSVFLLFTTALWWRLNGTAGREKANTQTIAFLTGQALAVDNVFVLLMLPGYFIDPPTYQYRVLMVDIGHMPIAGSHSVVGFNPSLTLLIHAGLTQKMIAGI